MTVNVLVVDKTGKIKETTIKTYNEQDLYKKAGFKSSDGFKCHITWNIGTLNNKTYNISVYGKTDGRANQENKYEFPPPIDNTLFFNSCIIINTVNDEVSSLRLPEWSSIYTHLYGGFDDIGDDDDDDYDDDDEIIDAELLTKSGYIKDDFIVDDDDDDYDDDEDDNEDDDYDDDADDEDDGDGDGVKLRHDIPSKLKINKNNKIKNKIDKIKIDKIKIDKIKIDKNTIDKNKIVDKNKKPNTFINVVTDYMDCSNELVVESYL